MKIPFPQRLQQAVRRWQEYTKPMRLCRKRMLQHYANGWYSGGTSFHSSMPINLIDRGVSIIAPYLVARNPRCMITPRQGLSNAQLSGFARTFELALAHLFDEIKLSEYTLRPAVIDALFCMGIVKTGVATGVNKIEIMGYLHDLYQPYCDRVDFDDYIGDLTARNRQEMKFEGNKYRLPLWYVQESGLYKNTDKLKPDLRLYGEDTSPELIAKEQVQEWDYHELFPTVELMDIWVVNSNEIVTLPVDGGQGTKILRTTPYDGPESGPYDTFAFRYFPDSIIPIPPVYGWLDQNKFVNTLLNKFREEAEREKRMGVYDLSAAEDAQRLRDANSGEMVGIMGGKDSVAEIAVGGAFSNQSFALLEFMLREWSKTGPNLDITGGRGTMAGTLGQEQLLLANAARELDDMASQVQATTASIMKKLAWFLYSTPGIRIPLIKRVGEYNVPTEFSEETKEGDFLDFTFDFVPYSMNRMNPEMKFQKLMQFVSAFILPTAQIAAQQGTVLDVQKLAQELARYLEITNLEDWYKSAVPNNINLNPYQPKSFSPSGVTGETTQGGQGMGSNLNNLNQQANQELGMTVGQM